MSRAPVVIVGGGTSGAIVARTLASSTDAPIVVLEPGRVTDDDNPRFLDGLTDDVLWPGEAMPQARAVGGGSAVNGMIISGAPPTWLDGLTRRAARGEAGSVGAALLGAGGRLSWLWWNNGRWNPGRAMLHLEEEGRIEIRREEAVSIGIKDGTARAVATATGEIPCSHVVMCAGALFTPRVLLRSGVGGAVGEGLQNHPTVTFTVARPGDDRGHFDACVVADIEREGAHGLLVAYERVSVTDEVHGAVSVSLMNPVSRGTAAGETEFALLADPLDRTRMEDLVALARETVGSAGLEIVGESDVHPVSHATSSCSGITDPDGLLELHGNITVADASVLRDVPHETPAASVTIAALRISRDLGRRLA